MSIKANKPPKWITDKSAESYSIIKDMNNEKSNDNNFELLALSDLRSFRIDYDGENIKKVRDSGFIKKIDLDK